MLMSSTKFVFFRLISKQKWPPWPIPQESGTLYSGARYVALWSSCYHGIMVMNCMCLSVNFIHYIINLCSFVYCINLIAVISKFLWQYEIIMMTFSWKHLILYFYLIFCSAQGQGLLCEEKGHYGDNVKYCGYCTYHYKKLVRVRKYPANKTVSAKLRR